MAIELDHLFICVSIRAPEADRLAAFGLTEGTPNTHPGQGTACRRFFLGKASELEPISFVRRAVGSCNAIVCNFSRILWQ